LEKDGYTVKLAHPLETKAIAKARVKTDKIDSKILAHLLRADLVPESWVPPKEVRELRSLVKHRAFLVRMRTRLKNRVHAELDKRDIDLKIPLFTRRGRELLKCLEIDAVNQLLSVMEVLDEQIREVSGKIKGLVVESEDAMLLTSIPGVGYYNALLLVAQIGDVNRFPDSEKLCAYAGLVPSVSRSGNKTVYGSITKKGSKRIRWALTQAVHAHVRHDTRLSRFYHRLAGRKRKQVAVVATARKMLKVVYWMLKKGEEFHSWNGEECATPSVSLRV
jgi:transposase